MTVTRLLVANRGEIAIRILRAAADLEIPCVAVHSQDDARSLHVRNADLAFALAGTGPAAYLDGAAIIAAAIATHCDAIHPGYGFLAENAGFALQCQDAGITFVGPAPATLALCGDKTQARQLATRLGIPLVTGTNNATSLDEARSFFSSLGVTAGPVQRMMIKALAGGGGRGMRIVSNAEELAEAWPRCASEARAAFGNGDLYVERLLPRVRHIEVQILGDGVDVTHFGERECSIQRRQQKIIEMAPSASLSEAQRAQLTSAAVAMARALNYRSLGTFEFLVEREPTAGTPGFAFIEANARLQVEHTVTEAVTGIDLVQAQLRIARGATLAQLQLTQAEIPPPRGFALQARINMETLDTQGNALPNGGTLQTFEMPSGPGVRVDTFGYAGYTTSPRYDSLLAKLIVHSYEPDVRSAISKTYRALCDCRIYGVETNITLLQNVLRHADFIAQDIDTLFLERTLPDLLQGAGAPHAKRYFDSAAAPGRANTAPANPSLAGARLTSRDPLAILAHGKEDARNVAEDATFNPTSATNEGAHAATANSGSSHDVPAGMSPVAAPLQGTIVTIDVRVGDLVRADQQVLVMEAMKMEHVIRAGDSGVVRDIGVALGDAVFAGHLLLYIEPRAVDAADAEVTKTLDLDHIRPDLAEALDRHAIGMDERRPDAVARRRKTGQRTTRENVDELIDAGSFIEYGPLVIAAQRRRRSVEDLIEKTPADGMVAGIGRVNGDLFGDERSQCVVMSYDYTVLAGTQGTQNHRKKDRMFELAQEWQLPVVFFTEGGGGRPGDTDGLGVAGLDCLAFAYFGALSGLVPLVGITSGRCFAGNAALLGCCDVVIATEGSNIGMGGPAMIEGGGLGIFRPEEVGPMRDQVPNGVVDIPVKDEAEAVQVAKRYLSYFQGRIDKWECADQRLLRSIIPENRLRIYDVRAVIETLADSGSVLEVRRHFGIGMVTAFARVEGRPIGIIANNPLHLAGAIDSNGADKAARFMQLCDAFDIPLLFLCDTPGIMVGPEVERTALVRHAARMFVTGASITVPFFTIVLRKSYGLGAQAMAGGSFKAPFFAVSWPTGEFGGMGLEGAVKLGYRNELAAIEDPQERQKTFDEMVARSYERGKGVNVASHFELDDVIDPMASRRWIVAGLRCVPVATKRKGKKRPCVDTW